MNRLEAQGARAVFDEPWQAQAFALAVQLNHAGAFTWGEWTEALSAQIVAAEPDDGDGYYQSWLAALESLVASKGLIQSGELAKRRSDWEHAYRSTPHGEPVTL